LFSRNRQSEELRHSLLLKYIADENVDSWECARRKQLRQLAGQPAASPSPAEPANPFNLKDLEEQDERDLKRLEIQCELNSQGASDLVVDLFMSDVSNKVFKENVLLAIALLEGGNTQVQRTVFSRLASEKNSEKFCKTFHERIEAAMREIKNLNSFMSSDVNDGE